jgi:hypothetical protein
MVEIPGSRTQPTDREQTVSNYRSTPVEQTYPPLVVRKRRAATRHEHRALVLRAQADELERIWLEYRAKHPPQKQAS